METPSVSPQPSSYHANRCYKSYKITSNHGNSFSITTAVIISCKPMLQILQNNIKPWKLLQYHHSRHHIVQTNVTNPTKRNHIRLVTMETPSVSPQPSSYRANRCYKSYKTKSYQTSYHGNSFSITTAVIISCKPMLQILQNEIISD